MDRYDIFEVGNATAIASVAAHDELGDIADVLGRFTLTSRMLMTPGGNEGSVPKTLNEMFSGLGWGEFRVDTETNVYMFPGHNARMSAESHPQGCEQFVVSSFYQRGYSVDNFKGRVALDVEWNPKDGNLDRDFAAYRSWHDLGVIDVAVLIVRNHESTRSLTDHVWNEFISRNPQYVDHEQPVRLNTTTTANYEKAVTRIKRGDLGSCPIVVFGACDRTWDGVPWDGFDYYGRPMF